MIVQIGNEIWEYDNNDKGLSAFLIELENYLTEHKLYISQCSIDDEQFYDEFRRELSSRFETVVKVFIHVVSLSGMIMNNIESLGEYLDRALPHVAALADQIYQDHESAWEHFEQLIIGLESIYTLLNTLIAYENDLEDLKSFTTKLSKLEQSVLSFSEAFDAKDTILISDIIRYEFTPLLNYLNEAAKLYIKNGETREFVH